MGNVVCVYVCIHAWSVCMCGKENNNSWMIMENGFFFFFFFNAFSIFDWNC